VSAAARLAVLALALAAGCGGAAQLARTPPPPPAAATPLPLFAPSADVVDGIQRSLERRYRTMVVLEPPIGIETSGERSIFVLYSYESFAAWAAYRALEDWEHHPGEWDATQEFEVWMSGAEAAGLDETVQEYAEENAARCQEDQAGIDELETEEAERQRQAHEACMDAATSADPEAECAGVEWINGPGQRAESCDEGDIWENARSNAGVFGCGEDRVGIARFALGSEGLASEEPAAAVVFDGQRCSPVIALNPHDTDGDGVPELAVEVTWREGVESVVEHLELVLLGIDLSVSLARGLFDRPAAEGNAGPVGPVPDAQFWFEDADNDGREELLIERFVFPGPCEVGVCSRFSRPAAVVDPAEDAFGIFSPCFARPWEPPSPGCRMEQVERTVLSHDRERRIWL
jgi:hypothetical protein